MSFFHFQCAVGVAKEKATGPRIVQKEGEGEGSGVAMGGDVGGGEEGEGEEGGEEGGEEWQSVWEGQHFPSRLKFILI